MGLGVTKGSANWWSPLTRGWYTVEARKLEDEHPNDFPKRREPAYITLNPYSKYLESTVGLLWGLYRVLYRPALAAS